MITKKTREQLLNELTELQERVAELEKSQLRGGKAPPAPGNLNDTKGRLMAYAAARIRAEQRVIESE